MLTFIVPVRHPQNARDWGRVKRLLGETVASIANQDSREWRGVVVANRGSDLPELPPQFDVAWVDFSPNPLHDLTVDAPDQTDRFEAFRYDKGHRVLAGLLHAPDSDHYMVVDDDDFVSAHLAGFVARHRDSHGWYFGNGFIWSEGSQWVFKVPFLHKVCGTTHILRRNLMKIPASAEEAPLPHIRWLGTHARITDDFIAAGKPLELLPFEGSVYRVGHNNAHSRSQSILSTYFLHKRVWTRPHVLAHNLVRLRRLTSARISQFGMPR